MRPRPRLSYLAVTGAVAVAMLSSSLAVASSAPGSVTEETKSTPWTGRDTRQEKVRAQLPEDRYAMAGGCYALRLAGSGYVARTPDGFAASAGSIEEAEPFHFQATDLGRYLLFGTAEDFVAASEGVLGEAAYGATGSMPGATAGGLVLEKTDEAADTLARSEANRAAGRGASVVAAPRASNLADWKVTGDTEAFTFELPETGQVLGVAPDGSLALDQEAATFGIEKTQGCAEFPEIEVNVDGPILGGETPFQETRGYVEGHLHMMAFEFLGGRARCGRPWHRFGVERALVDCPDHKPNGHGAALEAALSGGDPVKGHNTDGWPTFEGWPKPGSLTHEQVYYKWLERAWRGGLRTFTNLLVDNGVLCKLYPLKRHGCNEMDGVRRQAERIRELERYIDAQNGGPGEGWFRIVDDPFEAREVINQGKLAVILGIEVSVPLDCGLIREIPTCPIQEIDDRLQGVYDLGVRQMELVNKFDNAFTGVKGDSGLLGPIVNGGNFIETGSFWRMDTCSDDDGHEHDHAEARDHTQPNFHDQSGAPDQFSGRDAIFGAVLSLFGQTGAAPVYPEGPHCNSLGLSELGETMIREMVERGMLFDPDHMSSIARTEAMDLLRTIGDELRAGGSPVNPGVLSSHSWSDDTIYEQIYELGGVVTPHAGGSSSFVGKWRKHTSWEDERFLFGFGYGSDVNGFSAQGAPRGAAAPNPVTYPFEGFGGATIYQQESGTRAPYDINRDGVAHYGLYPDWIEDLRRQAGDSIVEDLELGAEAYLQMWERAVGVPGNACRSDIADLTPGSLDALEEGMTVEQVLRTLGQPKSRIGSTFYYCLGSEIGTVSFSPQGEATGWDAGDDLSLALDPSNPGSGQVTDEATFAATVTDDSGTAVAGESVVFKVGDASASATTDASGRAVGTVRLVGPPGGPGVQVTLDSAPIVASAAFTVLPEETAISLSDVVASKSRAAVASARLSEDGGALAGRTVSFFIEDRNGGSSALVLLGTADTDATGTATLEVPAKYLSKSRRTIEATYAGERDFMGSSASAFAYRT